MRETKSRWAPRWLLLVSAITMTLAACAGETADTTTAGTTAETTAPSAETTPHQPKPRPLPPIPPRRREARNTRWR